MEVNIKITFILWLIELIGSIILVSARTVFGHGPVGTATTGVFLMLFYFLLLPFFYLVNDSDVKSTIAEESWYRAMRGIFNRSNVEVLPK